MSLLKIRSALETALSSMSPSIATAWENAKFTPVTGTPYQQVFLDADQPINPEMGAGYQQSGIMNISLRYPLQAGISDAQSRAELIQLLFYRGASFVSGAVVVNIIKTAHIGKGVVVEDRWLLPVRVFFNANII